jgi:hypothetical protein
MGLKFCSLLHFCLIEFYYGIMVTLMDLFILIKMRAIIIDIGDRMRGYKAYLKILRALNTQLPDATATEMEEV